jgi:hypothetical protein
MFRFPLYVLMAFATAFLGVFWAARGFPMRRTAPQIVAQIPARLSSTFGDPQRARDDERKSWEAFHTAASDKNPVLDAIRLDALQAANAYALSPCDTTMKQNLIAAVTAYTRAWQQKLDCTRPLGMLVFCSDQKLQETAATFSTPLDEHVKEALYAAFEQKGIVQADFPPAVRSDMQQFAGPGLWFNESPVCVSQARMKSSKR